MEVTLDRGEIFQMTLYCTNSNYSTINIISHENSSLYDI